MSSDTLYDDVTGKSPAMTQEEQITRAKLLSMQGDDTAPKSQDITQDLFDAANRDDLAAFKDLLEGGADPSEAGLTVVRPDRGYNGRSLAPNCTVWNAQTERSK